MTDIQQSNVSTDVSVLGKNLACRNHLSAQFVILPIYQSTNLPIYQSTNPIYQPTSPPAMFGTQLYGLGAPILSALLHLVCGCSLLVSLVIGIALVVVQLGVSVWLLSWIPQLKAWLNGSNAKYEKCLYVLVLVAVAWVVFVVMDYFSSVAYALVKLVHAQTRAYSCTGE